MRRVVAVLGLLILSAAAAEAQWLWVGAGAGTSWEYQADAAPDSDWLHASSAAPALFAGIPLTEGTLLRLRAADIPRTTEFGGQRWDSRVRLLTIGVDYTVTGVLGDALLSGGFGRYELNVEGSSPPDIEDAKFGWYVGIGEWFRISERTRLTVELTADRSSLRGSPLLFTLWAGLALSF